MDFILVTLIESLISGVQSFIDGMLSGLFDLVFHTDEALALSSGVSIFSIIMPTFYGVGVSLIIMKFLKKAFDIYVLWSDGDPDTDPMNLLMNFVKAIATATVFPFLYTFFIDIADDLTTAALTQINNNTGISTEALLRAAATGGLSVAIFILMFLICYLILYFSFMMRGLEMLILQVGVPLACVGLLDNDKGVFKAYINQFVKAVITTIVQIVLCKIGLALMMSSGITTIDNIFWGIACMVSALSIPKILKEFLLPVGGGGQVSNTVYQTTRVISMASSAFKR